MEKKIKSINFSEFQLIELSKKLLEENKLKKINVTNKYAQDDWTLVCELEGSYELLLYNIKPMEKKYPEFKYTLKENKVYFTASKEYGYPKNAITEAQLNGTFNNLFEHIENINFFIELVINKKI
jgi:hypothetical protein|nr:MAG TPA: hypothetical protein [Caudoviricetes sp.]